MIVVGLVMEDAMEAEGVEDLEKVSFFTAASLLSGEEADLALKWDSSEETELSEGCGGEDGTGCKRRYTGSSFTGCGMGIGEDVSLRQAARSEFNTAKGDVAEKVE